MSKNDFIKFDDIDKDIIEQLTVDNVRSRCFCGILYQEDESQEFAIKCLFENKYKCVYIVHDRDKNSQGELKKSHIHFIIRFSNGRFLNTLADELKIKPNYLQPCSSFNSYCTYIVHLDEPFKEQYLLEEVEGPLYNDFLQAVNKVDSEILKVQKILKYLEENDFHISRSKLLKWVCSNSLYDVFRRGYSIFNDMLKEKGGLL